MSDTKPEGSPSPDAETRPAVEETAAPETRPAVAETAAPEPAPQPEPELAPEDTPITEWKDVDLGLADNPVLDADLLESFGTTCAAGLGLTPRQAKGIVEFQLNAIADMTAKREAEQSAILDREWGRQREANIRSVLEVAKIVERDGKIAGFTEALNKSGAGLDATVVRGLHWLASRIGEDGTGNGNGSAADMRPETAYEGIQRAFARARAGK